VHVRGSLKEFDALSRVCECIPELAIHETRNPMKACGGHLELGTVAIQINFSSERLAAQAREYLVLGDGVGSNTIKVIDYIEDDSVNLIPPSHNRPDAVHAVTEDLGKGRTRIVFNMFGQLNFVLHVSDGGVHIHHPAEAPLVYLLDEVLQIALNQTIAGSGGFILHGSCMVKDGNAVVFMGRSGSGKSSTAFNLARFGFDCYADDWVLVTSEGSSGLLVWPATKGLSIRPLSFKFFQEQGVQLTNPKRQENKYYFFPERSESPSCAVLKHICFVEVGGEPETLISSLSPEETFQVLLNEKRYFSLSLRQSTPVYAKILSEKVPKASHVRAGLDLDAQGSAIEGVLLGRPFPSKEKKSESFDQPGRKQNASLFKQAWSSPGEEPLTRLIPLLGNVDLKVFALAHAFFQNYPLAQMETLPGPFANHTVPQHFEATWLRTRDWLEGCRSLVQQSGIEVFRQFCFSWIKSAPHIYAFLNLLTADESEKSESVREAWTRFRVEMEQSSASRNRHVEVHVADFQASSIWMSAGFVDWWNSFFKSEDRHSHLYLWLAGGEGPSWGKIETFLEMLAPQTHRFSVVPVYAQIEEASSGPIEIIRFALKSKWSPKISRFIPLCRLTDEDASWILNGGFLETSVTGRPGDRFQCNTRGRERKALGDMGSCREISWPEAGVSFRERPLPACGSCGLYPLGFCRGGFFRTIE